jgi:hypothetical protein
MENYQVIKYTEAQEYQAHTDWISDQAAMQPGPRLFTLFVWLSDVTEGGGGATWFPQATVNGTESRLYWEYEKLNAYYKRWNNPKHRPNMLPPSAHFKDDGLRVFPKKGDAIMWPNVNLDNIYRQHPKTIHA